MNRFVLICAMFLATRCAHTKKEKLDKEFKDRKGAAPFLNEPQVRTLWIPDKIEGNNYIEGHYIHMIDKNASWKGN